MTDTQTDSTGVRLKSFIERIERLNEEKAATNADISEIYKEAKGTGFETRIIKKIVRERAMNSADLREEQELLELYRAALGNAT